MLISGIIVIHILIKRSQFDLSMIDPSKFYRNIILSLEKPFVENDSEDAIWKRVSFEIASKLKI